MNHAFGDGHESLYLSLIAGITSVGMTPRSVVELSGDARLELTFDLISRCAYSVHDLSCVQLTAKPFRVPRFNMPFELGLAVALQLQYGRAQHQFVLLEAVPNRLTQSLSDIAAFDPKIHGDRIDGVVQAIQNAFVDVPQQPLQQTPDLVWVARALLHFRRKTLHGVKDIFTPYPFKQLVTVARRLVEIRVTHVSAGS